MQSSSSVIPDEDLIPQLAIVLGTQSVLFALQQEWLAFPQGATYPEFRHVLEPYVRPCASPSRTSLRHSLHRSTHLHFPSHVTLSEQETDSESAVKITSRLRLALSLDALVPAAEVETNRESERISRLRGRQELAGLCIGPVDPLKLLFNRVDVHNRLRVTWENLLNYLVAEASAPTFGSRSGGSASYPFTFSRRLRGITQQQQPQHRRLIEGAYAETRTYQRFHRDVKEPPKWNCIPTDDDAAGVSASPLVREEEDISLLRFLDGLPGHRSFFFASTRSCLFVLYSKETLERVYTAPPEMLSDSVPSSVTYLAACDLFVSYSPDDRLLRSWCALASAVFAPITMDPLALEGFVRRLQTMPLDSPTYNEYAETIFVGDSFGRVLLVAAPHGRGNGTTLTVERIYENLHTRESGGLADFCVYGTHLYSSGFDGRLVATSLRTGHVLELGSVVNEHLTSVIYLARQKWVVAATSCGRQLLWWEAQAHSALPGTAFDSAGHSGHAAALISLTHVAHADLIVSADGDGVAKVWDMVTQRCVQSFRASRVPHRHGGTLSGVSVEGARTSSAGTRTAAQSGGGAGSGIAGLFMNLGLQALLPAATNPSSQVGGVHCHSVIYNSVAKELIFGFASSIECWALHGHTNESVCDPKEVCYDVQYDIRTRTFVSQSATRLSVWDGQHGYLRGVLSRATPANATYGNAELLAICLDDLGSRIFLATSDGQVVSHSTLALAADATQCTPASATLWWPAKPPHAVSDGGDPLCVEQMYYSSILRTWVAITTHGALLVRPEEEKQEMYTTSIAVSSSPLTLLRISEGLGLAAVADAQRVVYLYDMHAWADASVSKNLAVYGSLVDMAFLDNAPVLVTVHSGGVCWCWSCPPAVERFSLLGSISHPHLTSSIVFALHAERACPSAMPAEGTMRGHSATERRARKPSPTVAAPLRRNSAVNVSGRNEAKARPTASSAAATAPLASPVDSPFTKALVSVAGTPSGAMAAATTRPTSGFARARSLSGTTHLPRRELLLDGQSTMVDRILLYEREDEPLKGTTTTGDAVDINHRTTTTTTTTAAAVTASSEASVEFTSVAYDGQRHHLFLGDSDGDVHIYRMCALLQHYRLPRCTHASRAAFSLTASTPFAVADPLEAIAAAAPTLLRSVKVHATTMDSVASARPGTAKNKKGSMPSRSNRERRGVVSVRWIGDRDVLATSGNDHEVWFLSSGGDRLARLAAARPPPRVDPSDVSAAMIRQVVDATAGESLMEAFDTTRDDLTISSHSASPRPFQLPPLPRYEDATSRPTTASSPGLFHQCCTHTIEKIGTRREGGSRNETSPTASSKADATVITTTTAVATPLKVRPPAGFRTSSASPYLGSARMTQISHSISPLLREYNTIPQQQPVGPPHRSSRECSLGGESSPQRNGARASCTLSSAHGTPQSNLVSPPEESEYFQGTRSPLPNLRGAPTGHSPSGCDGDGGDTLQVTMTEWHRRALAMLRETRSFKPHSPVRPGSHLTMVHVEESKAHGPAMAVPSMVLPRASNGLLLGVRAAEKSLTASPADVLRCASSSTGDSISLGSIESVSPGNPTGFTAVLGTGISSSSSEGVGAGEMERIDPLKRKQDKPAVWAHTTSAKKSPLRVSGSAVAGPLRRSTSPRPHPSSPAKRVMQRKGASVAVSSRHNAIRGGPSPTRSIRCTTDARARLAPLPSPLVKADAGASCRRAPTSSTVLHPSARADETVASDAAPSLSTPPLPSMLAYSTADGGGETLKLYARELGKRLRRPRRWFES